MKPTQPLTDDELFDGLRATTLPADSFHHQDHLRAGWLYLEHWALPEALSRFSADLLNFATTHGAPGKFHTTITWALLFALETRRRTLGEGHTWDQLARSAPELFDWRAFLGRYYTDGLLWSDLAQQSFVLPDRLALDTPAIPPEVGASPPTGGKELHG